MSRNRFHIISEQDVENLQEWHRQALEFASGHRIAAPDHRLLLPAMDRVGDRRGTPRPRPTTIEDLPEGPCMRVTFNKPYNEGLTTRDYDPGFVFTTATHCVVGGRFVVEKYGNAPMRWDYSVLRVPGHIQLYALRLLVGPG